MHSVFSEVLLDTDTFLCVIAINMCCKLWNISPLLFLLWVISVPMALLTERIFVHVFWNKTLAYQQA